MSERQGPRINGSEEGRRRPWGWIIAAIIALVLILLIVPFACSALTGSDQGGSDGTQQDNASGDGGQSDSDSSSDSADSASSAEESTSASAATAPEDMETTSASETTGNTAGGSGGDSANDDAGNTENISAELAGFDGAEGDGTSVTVPAATVSGTDGWLVIRDSDAEDAEVLGRAPLGEGSNTDVTVELEEPVESGELYASIHADDPSSGEFDYPDGDPEIQSGGASVSRSFEYALTGGGSEEPLPDTGGMSAATIKSVSGVALLLSGVALVSIAKRRHANEIE